LAVDPADLQEEDAATQTGIENIRGILEGLRYRPLGENAVKAVIIDEVHQLSKSAMTALLKSLEDPPSWVYWFLCTTEASKIPVAVKTRCLTYQLKEVRFDDLMYLLEGIPESKDVDDKVLELCAREAGGSPRQALSNLGVCLKAENVAEAADLLRAAEASVEAFELARALMKGTNWKGMCALLEKLKETNPESVRHVVRAYMTKVAMGANERDAQSALWQYWTRSRSRSVHRMASRRSC
jgi:DNA polymerase III gamma/tau subunit